MSIVTEPPRRPRVSPEANERIAVRAPTVGDEYAIAALFDACGITNADIPALCSFHPLRRVVLVAERSGEILALAALQRRAESARVQLAADPRHDDDTVLSELVRLLVEIGNSLGIGTYFAVDSATSRPLLEVLNTAR